MAIRLQNTSGLRRGNQNREGFESDEDYNQRRGLQATLYRNLCTLEGMRHIIRSGTLWITVAWLFWMLFFPWPFQRLENDFRKEQALEELTYLDALYMLFVVATTTGYGDLTPLTTGGRILLFFWSVIALSLTGWLATTLYVSWLDSAPEWLRRQNLSFRLFMGCYQRHPKCRPCCRNMWRFATLFIGLIFVTVFLFVSAAIWYTIEEEIFADFGEALWFTYISASTIGFGDFSPITEEGRGFYIVFALIGTTSLALIIASLFDAVVYFHKKYKAKRLIREGHITVLSYPFPGLDMNTLKKTYNRESRSKRRVLIAQLEHVLAWTGDAGEDNPYNSSSDEDLAMPENQTQRENI